MGSYSAIPDDAELVTRTLAGDDEAFGQLFDRYVRLVRAMLVGSARDEATLHDLTQDCFIRAWKKLPELRDGAKFRPWVVAIAHYVAAEHRRSQQRDRHQFEPAPMMDTDQKDDSPSTESITDVLQELQSLPENEQLAVQLFYLDEQGADLTANLLGMSRSGVYVVLKRACRRLAAACGKLPAAKDGAS